MSPSRIPPRRILHPTDFTRGSEVAFAHALKLAHLAQAHLDILHVDASPASVPWSEFPGVRSTLTRWGVLRPGASKGEVGDLGLYIRKIKAFGIGVAGPILKEIHDTPPDLIVLATHARKGIDRWLHREVAGRLSREASVLTLFIPYGVRGFVSAEDGTSSLKRVLIPVDTDPDPQSAVDGAWRMASLLGSEDASFTLLHVGDDGSEMPAVELPEHKGWEWEKEVRRGEVVDEILSEAREREHDLISVATQGHDGFLDMVRGSITDQVLAEAPCPILAIPV